MLSNFDIVTSRQEMMGSIVTLAALLGLLSLTASAENAGYLGCFRERSKENRLFNGDSVEFHESNSPELCWENCAANEYDFAGVQEGSHCYCSNDKPSDEWLTEDAECNMPCTGDESQTCGGVMRMGAYNIVDARHAAVTDSYLGCYPGDAMNSRTVGIINKENFNGLLTTEFCKFYCEMYAQRYFAIQGGSQCLCGNEIEGAQISQEECKAPCDGDKSELCGGYENQLSIYMTDIPDDMISEETPDGL